MELLATDMKRRGQYLARTLSFAACTYRVRFAPLTDGFAHLHARCGAVWRDLRALFADAVRLTGADPKRQWAAFWGSFQRCGVNAPRALRVC
jgi:hypothetical protein